MKKLVFVVLFVFFIFGVFVVEKINFGVLVIYFFFEFIGVNNEIVGFDIDLVKVLCK